MHDEDGRTDAHGAQSLRTSVAEICCDDRVGSDAGKANAQAWVSGAAVVDGDQSGSESEIAGILARAVGGGDCDGVTESSRVDDQGGEGWRRVVSSCAATHEKEMGSGSVGASAAMKRSCYAMAAGEPDRKRPGPGRETSLGDDVVEAEADADADTAADQAGNGWCDVLEIDREHCGASDPYPGAWHEKQQRQARWTAVTNSCLHHSAPDAGTDHVESDLVVMSP